MTSRRPSAPLSVAFDPLDGSSIVDTNFSVGTIFGVWPGAKLTEITGAKPYKLLSLLRRGPGSSGSGRANG